MKNSCSILLLAVCSFCLGAVDARGQAALTFAGGNGTPLSITLNQPVALTINSVGGGMNFGSTFIFDGVGMLFSYFSPPAVTSNYNFTLNNSAPHPLSTINNEYGGGGSITPDDLLLQGPGVASASGDNIILNAGSLTTTGNFAGAPPTSGSYPVFIVSSNGLRISTFGATVPEPSDFVLILVGGLTLALFSHKRMGWRIVL